MNYEYKSFGAIGSNGGFKEDIKDMCEVRYYYESNEMPPKISLYLTSVNAEGKDFERKSFRVKAENIGDTMILKNILLMIAKSMGYVYGKQTKGLSDDEAMMQSGMMASNITSLISANFKDGCHEARIEKFK